MTAQSEFDKHQPPVILGASRGGEVPMNIKCGVRVLERGGWHPNPKWSVFFLGSKEASLFSSFIQSEYGSEEY